MDRIDSDLSIPISRTHLDEGQHESRSTDQAKNSGERSLHSRSGGVTPGRPGGRRLEGRFSGCHSLLVGRVEGVGRAGPKRRVDGLRERWIRRRACEVREGSSATFLRSGGKLRVVEEVIAEGLVNRILGQSSVGIEDRFNTSEVRLAFLLGKVARGNVRVSDRDVIHNVPILMRQQTHKGRGSGSGLDGSGRSADNDGGQQKGEQSEVLHPSRDIFWGGDRGRERGWMQRKTLQVDNR